MKIKLKSNTIDLFKIDTPEKVLNLFIIYLFETLERFLCLKFIVSCK